MYRGIVRKASLSSSLPEAVCKCGFDIGAM